MDTLPVDSDGKVDLAKAAEIDVMDRLSKVEAGLLSVDPQIQVHCSSILKTLHTYEELVHLMDDAKVRTLMAGMQVYRRVELVKEAATSKGKKSLSKTTVDDI